MQEEKLIIQSKLQNYSRPYLATVGSEKDQGLPASAGNLPDEAILVRTVELNLKSIN